MQSHIIRRLKILAKSLPFFTSAYRKVRWSPLISLLIPNPRRHLNRYVRSKTGGVVLSGPFSGMKLIPYSNREDCNISPKLLGTYEQELHFVLNGAPDKNYDAVVNIGCAEGYYAVGACMLLKNTQVIAYDLDRKARETTKISAIANGVSERIEIREACSSKELCNLISQHSKLLVISDCEGYEREIFSDHAVIRALRGSDILIECHDNIYSDCTEHLFNIFKHTHTVKIIQASGRNPNLFDFLADLREIDRWQAVYERRPFRMNWLWCEGGIEIDSASLIAAAPHEVITGAP